MTSGTLVSPITRVLSWELAGIKRLTSEVKKFEQAGIENSVLKAFLIWRFSMLLVAIPALLFSTILAWIGLAKYQLGGGFSAIGNIVWLLPYFAGTVLFATVITVL